MKSKKAERNILALQSQVFYDWSIAQHQYTLKQNQEQLRNSVNLCDHSTNRQNGLKYNYAQKAINTPSS